MAEEKERRLFRDPSGGFTLIELLISLTILIIVLASVYATFFTVQRALERFNSVSLKYQEARTALDIIRREIEGAFLETPKKGEQGGGYTYFSFKDKDIFGKPASELGFTAFTFRGSGLNTIFYRVEEDEKRMKLTKQESSSLGPVKGYSLDMISGIEGFTVETVFNGKTVKAWDSAEAGKLPDMIKVTIDFDDNGKRVSLSEFAKPVIGLQL
ncbi:MAG: prepilin-type N-terminal cleavage/methylation domain-containing protein [Nitrospirae bacterium]|nr:prepilin-type N-terminal cleavage/methylation domain-containing protein [Nitrospirota bacterium]